MAPVITAADMALIWRALRRLDEYPYLTGAGQGIAVAYSADDLRTALRASGITAQQGDGGT